MLLLLTLFIPFKGWAFCSAPSVPFGGPPTKPTTPYCVNTFSNTHTCSDWEINSLRQAHPECPIYLYPAGHGFNCEQRDSFNSTSSAIAFERTIQHIDKYI